MANELKPKSRLKLFAFTLLGLVGILVLGAGAYFVWLISSLDLSPAGQTSYLAEATRQELFAQENAVIRQEVGWESITFYCTILEGRYCYFVNEEQSVEISRDLARQVIDEIGYRNVEGSTGWGRNSVAVRCQRLANTAGLIECRVTAGSRWVDLPLES